MKAKPINILLVEDSPAHTKIIRGFLHSSKVSQFKPAHAETLKECLHYLEKLERFVEDIHLLSVVEKTAQIHPKRARAYSIDGDLLALEVMGNLVNYYRHSRRVWQRGLSFFQKQMDKPWRMT